MNFPYAATKSVDERFLRLSGLAMVAVVLAVMMCSALVA